MSIYRKIIANILRRKKKQGDKQNHMKKEMKFLNNITYFILEINAWTWKRNNGIDYYRNISKSQNTKASIKWINSKKEKNAYDEEWVHELSKEDTLENVKN